MHDDKHHGKTNCHIRPTGAYRPVSYTHLEETAALKVFLADSEKKNMVFEYDTPEEAKKRYDSMRNYRNTNKLQDIYDVWRSDALICIVKTKKGAARK